MNQVEREVRLVPLSAEQVERLELAAVMLSKIEVNDGTAIPDLAIDALASLAANYSEGFTKEEAATLLANPPTYANGNARNKLHRAFAAKEEDGPRG